MQRKHIQLHLDVTALGAADRLRYLPNEAPDDLGDFNARLETVGRFVDHGKKKRIRSREAALS
jgi:hypothetical protein